jgi:hypothetical protein
MCRVLEVEGVLQLGETVKMVVFVALCEDLEKAADALGSRRSKIECE